MKTLVSIGMGAFAAYALPTSANANTWLSGSICQQAIEPTSVSEPIANGEGVLCVASFGIGGFGSDQEASAHMISYLVVYGYFPFVWVPMQSYSTGGVDENGSPYECDVNTYVQYQNGYYGAGMLFADCRKVYY